MSDESFATGNGLTGDLLTVWTNNISGGVADSLIDDPNREKFDILRGWPLEGALSAYYPPNSSAAIEAGMVVSLTAGELVKADSPDLSGAPPIMLMVAIEDQTSEAVTESGSLTVLTSNFVFRTDQLDDAIGTYTVGNSVTADGGLVSSVVGTSQVLGTIRAVDSVAGTVDIEVN